MTFAHMTRRARLRRGWPIAGARVLLLGLMAAPAMATSTGEVDAAAPADETAITYPTTSSPAAAQAAEWFDIDVAVPSEGTVRADLRAASGPDLDWIPLEVATELPERAVVAGPNTAMAKAPVETTAGEYVLRVQIVDSEGAVFAEEQIYKGVTIEQHDLPTGFESTDAAAWTSHTQEQAFLAELADTSPRAALRTLGETVNGLPYNLLTIGAGAPASAPDVDSDAVLLVCSQHGDEPSGREACMQHARRLALSTDSRVEEYLSQNTVLVIPSANPDGSQANTRENANGVDINRDHLRLEEPETRMLAEVMRDARPETVHDLHEMSGQDRPDLETVWGRHPEIDEAVRDYGAQWGNNWVRPRIEAAGYTTGPYLANPGSGENTTLTNGAMLRNLNGVISETNTSVKAAEGETEQSARLRRVDSQAISIHETLRQHRTQRDEIAQGQQAARERNVDLGYTQQGPYFFFGNSESSEPPPPDAFIMKVPCGYLLTAQQVDDRADWLELSNVSIQESPDPDYEAFVPMWQQSSAVIPLMFDERARSNEISGEAAYECSD